MSDELPAGQEHPEEPGARLECRGLSGGRGTTVVFRDLDLSVAAGSVLALLEMAGQAGAK